MSRINIRIKPDLEERMRTLFLKESQKKKTQWSDFIRDLLEIGVMYKESQYQGKEFSLSPFESEVLRLLFHVETENGFMVSNSFIEGKTRFKDAHELHGESLKKADSKLAEFIEYHQDQKKQK